MRIVVACGGVSGEREVSLRSGEAVTKGLSSFCDAVCVDITSIRDFLEKWDTYKAEGVFIALHGGWGEDGRLQAALEGWGIPYTGSAPSGCMAAMDKNIARLLLTQGGVPVAPGGSFHKRDRAQIDPYAILREWRRVVIKPSCGGSTIGISIAQNKEELQLGLDLAFSLEDHVVIEKFINGSELTVTVFEEDGKCVALPPVEMRPLSGFYDYESKYTGGKTEYLCPAPVDEAALSLLSSHAIAAHRLLGCSVYSRVDFRRTEDGELFVLEANTAPGMTATSLVPKAAAAYGWDFPELLRRIVNASFSRFENNA